MTSLRELLKQYHPEFFKELDPNLILFAKELKKMVREEKDCVIGITAYPGEGKSNLTSILGMLIDMDYNFEVNICFIPTSSQITETYMNLKMYSFLHIDEASRGLHKHKWHEKIQQTLNQLYDTEREGHFLVTALLMPRFQNFTENFRNFRIKYWIHIPMRGIAIFYKKDEDKDVKDPWHIDENYKSKIKIWKGRKVFERNLADIIRTEQRTPNYWFYCKIPAIPKDIWAIYQELKKKSRSESKTEEAEIESYKEKVDREKKERWARIAELKGKGYTHLEIGAMMNMSAETIRRNVRAYEAYREMNGKPVNSHTNSIHNIFNLNRAGKNQKDNREVEQRAERGTQTGEEE